MKRKFSNMLSRLLRALMLIIFTFNTAMPTPAAAQPLKQDPGNAQGSVSSNAANTTSGKTTEKPIKMVPVAAPVQASATPQAKTEPSIAVALSASPRFVTGNGTVSIDWAIEGTLPEGPALILQINLADGFTPPTGAAGTYNASTHTLTLPVSGAKGQFLLNVLNPGDNTVFYASLNQDNTVLAQSSLSLPKHEQFTARKSGSSFSAQNGKVRVSFPAGALPEDATVDLGAPAGEAVPAYSLSGKPFEIKAQGLQSKKDLHEFSEEVAIQLDYSQLDLQGRSETDLHLYWYDPATQEWRALVSYADPKTRILYALTNHFTVFDTGINDFQATRLPSVDSFQVSTFTGAGTYSLPIEVPAGPGGLQPNLALSYNSQVIDQSTIQTQASWVGMGWSLETGSIERNTHGTTTSLGDDTWMLNVGGISATIVKNTDGTYHAADENFMKYSFDSTADTWTVLDKSGNTYFFEKRVQMKYTTCTPTSGKLTYQWWLTRVRNIFGKELTYTYVDEIGNMGFSTGSGCQNTFDEPVTNATFPDTIVYPNTRYRVRFEREPRSDYTSSWISDFAYHNFQRSRLKALVIEQDATLPNPDGIFETTVRKYEFKYALDAAAGAPPYYAGPVWPGITWSAGGKATTLVSVQQYGLGGTSALPATSFTYNDYLHVTQVNNGYGGKVDFNYGQWTYETNGRVSHTSKTGFTDVGEMCNTGHFSPYSAGASVSCIRNTNVGDELKLRGTAINPVAINSLPFIGNVLTRPGGAYLFVGGWVTLDPHIQVSYGFFDGSAETPLSPGVMVSPSTDSKAVVVLPGTASKADVLLRAWPDDNVSAGYAKFHAVTIKLLPSYYRVNSKVINDGQNHTYTFNYAYEGAAVNDSAHAAASCADAQLEANPPTCYQYYEKYSEFRGHSQVTETGPDGRKVITTFNQDDILKGRPNSVTIKDASGKIYSQQLSSYASTSLPTVSFYPNIGIGRYWITTTSQESRIYKDDGSYKGTKSAFTYEPTYGNLTDQSEYSWNWGWILYRKTHTDYFPNVSGSLYLTGLPARQQVLDALNNLLAESLNIYDSAGTYNTAPTVGKLAAVRSLVSGTNYNQVSFTYGSWGNRTGVTTYDTYGTAATAPSGGARAVLTTFDPAYATYPIAETTPPVPGFPAGFTTSWNYDFSLGLPTSQTDANNVVVSAGYDAFGRLTKLVKPGDDSANPTFQVIYNDTVLPVALPFRIDLKQRVSGNSYYTLRRSYDGLGRQIKTETGSTLSGAFSLYNTATAAFDAYGHASSQSTPFGAGESPAYSTISYDVLGRPTTVNAPDGTGAAYAYNGLTTSVTDAKSHTTTTNMDSWGRTTSVTPPTGPGVTYAYDPLNHLVSATRGGLTTTINYDKAGRKTNMADPDMGTWSYTYNALGALTAQTDSRGCILNLSYDNLSRLTGKSSSGGGCNQQVTSAYSYDSGSNGKGRRTGMTDLSGSSAWSYDTRGRVTSESKTITGQPAPFVTLFSYNSADLPVTMTYPDGEVVTNTYTPQMLLDSVKGSLDGITITENYVQSTLYDSAGRIDVRQFGNGTQSDYEYYNWNQQGGRLRYLKSGIGATPDSLQSLEYAYDQVGNISWIKDWTAGGPQTQTFTYDALDRLISASASGGADGLYSEATSYDMASGNITGKNGVNYTYNSAHPHAVGSLSNGNNYQYDANGNMTGRVVNGQAYSLNYDAENRLVSAAQEPGGPTPTPTPSGPTPTPSPTATPSSIQSIRVNYSGVNDGPVRVVSTSGVPLVAALRDALPGSYAQMMGLPQQQLSDTFYFPLYNNVAVDEQLRFANLGSANTTVTVTIGGVVQGSYALAPNEVQLASYTDLNSGPVKVQSSGGVPIVVALRDAWTTNGAITSISEVMGLPQEQLSDTYLFPWYNNVSMDEQLRLANLGSADTTVTVTIGGVVRGTHPLHPNETLKVNYAGVNAGPVKVQSSGGVPIMVVLRDNIATSFTQMTGLPQQQLSDSFYFPSYDNVSLNEQMRLANMGSVETTVTVKIGGVVRGTHLLQPNQALLVNYAGVDGGPVRVQSSGGVPIVAAMRDAWTTNGVMTSISQVMGMPGNQLSHTYLFPWYNNVSLDTQLRVGNASSTAGASINVSIGGSTIAPGSFTLSQMAHTPGGARRARLAMPKSSAQRSKRPSTAAFENASFVYDGDGKMVKAVFNNTTTTIYVGAHYQITDGVVTKYYQGGAFRVGGTLYYGLTDHLGSTSMTIDASGSKIAEMRYTAWGEVRYASGSTPSDRSYTGQRSYMADFGLMFYNARWYDPSIGRFAQADNIELKVGDKDRAHDIEALDRFAYVINNPMSYNDPTGHTYDPCKYRPCSDGNSYHGTVSGWWGVNVASLVCVFAGCFVAPTENSNLWTGDGDWEIQSSLDPMSSLMPMAIEGPALKTGMANLENYAEASVCRAGICTDELFETGTGVVKELDETLSGISVSTAPGKSIEELSAPFKNGKLGVVTGGDIAEAGGTIVLDPTHNNPFHAMINGLTAEQLEALFGPTVRLNPNKSKLPY